MLRKLREVAEAPEAPARPDSEAGRAGGGAPPAALRRAGLRCQWERALTDHPQMRVFRTLSEQLERSMGRLGVYGLILGRLPLRVFSIGKYAFQKSSREVACQ